MSPLTSFDDQGRRVEPQPGPRGRVIAPAVVLCVLGTAWQGDPMVTVKAAAVLGLVALVVAWIALPYLQARDQLR